jgi:hypothetical protein
VGKLRTLLHRVSEGMWLRERARERNGSGFRRYSPNRCFDYSIKALSLAYGPLMTSIPPPTQVEYLLFNQDSLAAHKAQLLHAHASASRQLGARRRQCKAQKEELHRCQKDIRRQKKQLRTCAHPPLSALVSLLRGFVITRRCCNYTVVHHYRYTHVHHFRYEHGDDSTPFAPR